MRWIYVLYTFYIYIYIEIILTRQCTQVVLFYIVTVGETEGQYARIVFQYWMIYVPIYDMYI